MVKTACCATPSRLGFAFNILLSTAMVFLGLFTITMPWRSLTFTGGYDICLNYKLEVFNGLCEKASFAKASNCISWADANTWYSFDTINSEVNNYTKLQKDAKNVWPVAGGLVATGFGFLCASLFGLIFGLEECASSTVAQTMAGLFQLGATVLYLIAFTMIYGTDQLVGSAYQFCFAHTTVSKSELGGISAAMVIFLGAITTVVIIFPGVLGRFACIEALEEDDEDEKFLANANLEDIEAEKTDEEQKSAAPSDT